MCIIFPPHLTYASALPGETRNSKIAYFHLNAAYFLPKTTWNTLKYHLVRAEPPFTVKTIDWMHQTGPGILLSVTHMLYVNQDCHGVSHCVKDRSCSSSSLEWKLMDSINGISYYLNKCRCYQIHHRSQFFFQEDSALVRCACNYSSTLD